MQTITKGSRLSLQQARLWSLQRGNEIFQVRCALHMQGMLHKQILRQALAQVISQHEILRTVFSSVPGMDMPLQVVTNDVEPVWEEISLESVTSADREAQLTALLRTEPQIPYALERGPLLHATLVHLAHNSHVMVLNLPVLCADVPSLSLLTAMLEQSYTQLVYEKVPETDQEEEPLQYADISAWQNEILEEDEAEAHREFWRSVDISQVSTMRLPFVTEEKFLSFQNLDIAAKFVPHSQSVDLEETVQAGLLQLAATLDVSPSAILLACWDLLLRRLTGQQDLVLGVACDGRHYEELSNAIGPYSRVVPLHFQTSEDLSFAQYVKLVESDLAEAIEQQSYFSWEDMRDQMNGSSLPLVLPIQFEWEIWSLPQRFAEVQVSLLQLVGVSEPFALKLGVVQQGESVQIVLHSDPTRLSHAQVQRLAQCLHTLLHHVLASPQQPAGSLPLLPPQQQEHLLQQWRGPTRTFPQALLPDWIEQIAQRFPHLPAVRDAHGVLSYRQLCQQANQLAHLLLRLGVQRGDCVACCLPRQTETLVVLLGILKAGACLLPLDPQTPAQRLAFCLRHAQARLLLSTPEILSRLPPHPSQDLSLQTLWHELSALPNTPPALGLGGEEGAYVIYTSGSTGEPKGVLISHGSLHNYTHALLEVLGRQPGRHFALVSTLAADLGHSVLYGALASGGCLHLLSQETATSAQALSAYQREHRVDVLKIVPSHLAALLSSGAGGELLPREQLLLGGEVVPPGLLAQIRATGVHCRVYNHYGPTETTVGVLLHDLGVLSQQPPEALPAQRVPLGRPFANTQVCVLDHFGHPVPVGVQGELYVAGAGLAQGYLHAPQQTQERFVWLGLGAGPQKRYYRTGDLVRISEEGELLYEGRADGQVKLRGHRIEVGEIEQVLLASGEVSGCAVVLEEREGAEAVLVAYVVARGGEGMDEQRVRGFVGERLPEVMVPGRIVVLSALPLTANGKLDRKRVAAISQQEKRERRGGVSGPRDAIEAALVEIWSTILAVKEVGREENFFALGGHSLLATRVIAQVHATLGVELPIASLFEHPSIASLARCVRQNWQGGQEEGMVPLGAQPRRQGMPLSFAQQRLWFLDQLDPGSLAYNKPVALYMRGRLHSEAFTRALQKIVQRHEILRTHFEARADGPVQVVEPIDPQRSYWQVIDLNTLPVEQRQHKAQQLARDEAVRPFDLAHGPLLRIFLLRLSSDEHVLLLTMHHVVSDGWSNSILINELTALYAAFVAGEPSPLSPLPIQYADYATWQRQWLQGTVLERQLAYWIDQLQDIAILELPTDHQRPAVQTFNGARQAIVLPLTQSQELKELSLRQDVTLFMTLLATFQVLLARYSGQNDIAIGTTIANRTHSEIENLIGFFANTLVLRTDLSGNPRFSELLGRVREVALHAYTHQDIPFEELVEKLQPERDLSRSPLFQVEFTLQYVNQPVSTLGEVEISPLNNEVSGVKFDLALLVTDTEQGLHCVLEYNTDLFEADSISRLLAHWQTLLAGVVAHPEYRIADLPLLTPAERQQLLQEWNDTHITLPLPCSFPLLFANQVDLTADAIALADGETQLTYHKLDQLTTQFAHRLRELGVGSETLVGIYLERGLDLIISILACFKAGGAYMPLDPAYPSERLGLVLANARPQIVVTHPDLQPALSAFPVALCCLQPGWQALLPTDLLPLPASVSPHQLAYVIYTSGSTGQPKGAMITQQGMLNHLWAKIRTLQLTHMDYVAQTASHCFDISVWQFLAALLVGGRVLMMADDVAHDPLHLPSYAATRGVTILEVVPSLLQALLDSGKEEALNSLRWLVVTGEAFPVALGQRWLQLYPSVPLINAYGPTECSDDVTQQVITKLPVPGNTSIPIGRALANTQLYILDRSLEPLPVGIPGQLYAGGAGVGRGYLHDPLRTAEVFLPNPFAQQAGERLYKTGDLARYQEDGSIEFLGRLDTQMKLRGYRIELGEIEAVLARYPAVRESVAVVREETAGDQRLIAYVVARQSFKLSVEEVYSYLQEQLPSYMIPAHLIVLEALPLTPNGKIDREALPAPGEAETALHADTAPRTPIEELLAGLWTQVLKVPQVGLHENFFAIGGHSLLATQLVSRIREVLHREFPLRGLFDAPTIAELAERVELLLRSERSVAIPPLVIQPRDGALPLSFAQQRLWFLDQLEPGSAAYTIPLAVDIHGTLNVEALTRGLEVIVRRHESLRTRFEVRAGKPVQCITAPEQSFCYWRVIDVQALPEEQRLPLAEQLARWEAEQPFDLVHGPLLRVHLLRLQGQEHILLCTMHHIVSDGWSNGVLIEELSRLYTAFSQGESSPLAELPLQYADYALWQRQWLQGVLLESQLAYWTRQLQDVPSLELPTDHPRPARQTFHGAMQQLVLPVQLSQQLKLLSQQEGVTLFMTLLTAFQVLLARYSGQQDIAVGTPIANRTHAEIEGLIGFFANTLVLRTNLQYNPRFTDLLARVREVALEAYAHQDVPFEKIVEVLQPERDPARSPLFQVAFALQNAAQSLNELPGVTLVPLPGESTTVLNDLFLIVEETEQGLHCIMRYSTDLFEASSISRLLGHWHTILAGIVLHPERRLSDLPLLTVPEQRQILVEWNSTEKAAYLSDACIPQLVEVQVERTPDAIAISCESEQLTYQQLNRQANKIARKLIECGVEPEKPVALFADRDISFWIAVLAIFKAGGVYVPLDPLHPSERTRQVLDQSNCVLVLTTRASEPALLQLLGGAGTQLHAPVLDIETLLESEQLYANLPPRCAPDNVAYVLYTSGSTGTPKGVMVEHKGMLNHIYAKTSDVCLTGIDSLAQNGSQCFDISVWQCFAALLLGGRVLVYKDEIALDPARLLKQIEEDAIAVLQLVPSMLRELIHNLEALEEKRPALSALKWIVPTGDALPTELCRRWLHYYPAIPLLNTYGSTECSDDQCHDPIVRVRPEDEALPIASIGSPIPNMQAYVLDSFLNPVPVGVLGELYVGGIGVGRGYLNDPGRTATTFLPDPFSTQQSGRRLYKTGDIARYLPDGRIEFSGRVDHQMKLRGFRIEPGEVEAMLDQHPAVQESVVVAREDVPGDKRLVAYIVQNARYQSGDEEDSGSALETEHIEQYQTIYDQFYGQSQVFSAQDSAINLGVWTSSYTNKPFLEEEILENVNDTVQRVLALHPGRILEIGCGTGLLLFRIAPHCEQYCGVDISDVAIQRLRGQLEMRGLSQEKISLFQRAAHELDGLGEESFDMVLINEVIQYFPSVEHLMQVLKNAARFVKPGGCIFIGGSRNLSLLEIFHTSIQLHRAAPSLSPAQLRQRVREHMFVEKEFVIDPAFFVALQQQMPEIAYVQLRLKGGHYHNEMTKFRYDAIVHIKANVEKVFDFTWLDWQEQELDISALRHWLMENRPEVLGLKHVPNARLLEDVKAWELLTTRQEEFKTVEDLREAVQKEVHLEKGIEPESLWALGRDLSYIVDVRWGAAGYDCDVLLRRIDPQEESSRLRVPVWPEERLQPGPWHDYADNPLQGRTSRKVIPQLRSYLREKLPDYMVPSAFVVLQALPLTSNGKVDRRALPAPSTTAIQQSTDIVAPRNPIEEVVAQFWQEILGLEQVGIHDNFFELGGHSLLATQLISRIRSTLHIELPLRSLFETPTVSGVAAHVERTLRGENNQVVRPLEPAPRSQQLPLSFSQQRLWFLDQLEPGSTAFSIPMATRISGRLDREVLIHSLQEIVRRHENLRTHFVEQAGQPVQRIVPPDRAMLHWQLVDLETLPVERKEHEAQQLALNEAACPFDLAHGPLLRVCVLRLMHDDHILLFTMHHIVSDGWSNGVLMNELITLYAAFLAGEPSPLPVLPIQYADYAIWQRQWLQGDVLERQLTYWTRQLQDVPALELPTDHPRPAIQTFNGAEQVIVLPAALTRELKLLSQREDVTLFMTLLAAFQTLLLRYSGQDDIAVGSLIANRTQSEIEKLIGFFVNTLVLRTDLSGNPRFNQLLDRVREVALGAYAHQDIPFEKIVEELQPERDLSRSPLFQVMFSLLNAPDIVANVPGLDVQPLAWVEQAVPYDILFALEEKDGMELQCVLKYNTDLFEAESINRMLSHWQILLEGIVAQPEARLSDLPLLSSVERQQMLSAWNETRYTIPQPFSFVHLFTQQVRLTPDAIAVLSDEGQLTYSELDRRALSLAYRLHTLGVGPDCLVALLMERDLHLLISILAIFRVGASYLPLDPVYPPERIALILEDAHPQAVITQSVLVPSLPATHPPVVCLSETLLEPAPSVSLPLPATLNGQQLAYVIYTSGSTGRPKGAMVHQQGLMNHLQAKITSLQISAQDCVAQTASQCFDISVWQFLSALLVGGSTQIITDELAHDPTRLLPAISRTRVTLLEVVPSLLAALLAQDAEQGNTRDLPLLLRWLVVTGEVLPTTLARLWLQRYGQIPLVNAYGPTECSDDVTQSYSLRLSLPDLPNVPIGHPLINTQLYVLDQQLQPVPVGVPGQLYVAGWGVGRGYLADPIRTAQSFLPHPFAQQPGERLYQTGDRARYLDDGSIEFLGRMDRQIKLRGYRIELGEIESVLKEHPAIREGVVVVREDEYGDQRLVAYLVCWHQEQEISAQVHGFLRDRLPAYMVPSHLIQLEALPLTTNGKVDQRALPALEHQETRVPDLYRRELHSAVEELLAGIWSQVLDVDTVGPQENFFELGGHSLLATRVISRVRTLLQVEVPLRTLFEAPTLRQFAARIELILKGKQETAAPPLLPIEQTQDVPLSFAQQRLWFIDQLEPGGVAYNLPLAVRLQGTLNIAALDGSLRELLRRQESLRTTFQMRGDHPVRVVGSAPAHCLVLVEATGLPSEQRDAEVRRLIWLEAHQPFDLAGGPLLRFTLLRLASEEHVVLFTMQHIISDAWSMEVFIAELTTLYNAFVAGLPSPLPELSIQYADYAAWQRAWLQGEVLQSQVQYWTHQLRGAIPLELPTDYPRPAVQSFQGSHLDVVLPPTLYMQLSLLSQHQGVTLFMTLLAAFQVLLARYSGQVDISVGTVIANRTRSEVESLIGFFVNTLVLRVDLSDNPSFLDLLVRVREVCLGAYAHQDLPFEKLVEVLQPERDLSRPPLFQVAFVLQNTPGVSEAFPGISIEPVQVDSGIARFDLTLFCKEVGGELLATIEYNTDLFQASTINRMAAHFERLLYAIVEQPGQPVTQLPLLSQSEQDEILYHWNSTDTIYPRSSRIEELFTEQAIHAPDSIALVFDSACISYDELHRRSNQLAHHLQKQGVKSGTIVGIYLERSADLVIAILGTLKAGATYLPLDPVYPPERLAFILQDAGVSTLLVSQQFADRLDASKVQFLCLDSVAALIANESVDLPEYDALPGQAAYIMYTSGSTGLPKGIMIPHRAVIRLVCNTNYVHLDTSDRMAFASNIAFDASTFELWGALLPGGCLVGVPDDTKLLAERLERHLREQAITATFVTTALFNQLVRERPGLFASVKHLLVGGDALDPEAIRLVLRYGAPERLLNGYGPTEGTTFTTWYHVQSLDTSSLTVPIGRPLANTQVYVLDGYLQPVPIGVAGELYIGGDGLASNYLNRPDLTAERFIPDPFSREPGRVLYCSGDIVRLMQDGNIEFIGRNDNQVKIRGFRIELGEIEAQLARHPALRDVVVTMREDAQGSKQLTVYAVARVSSIPTVAELREYLTQLVPAYMVPSVFVFLNSLPLTPNGKVDRQALPAPSSNYLAQDNSYAPPRSPVEETLALIWARLLGREQVGRHENFFELGGHSLLATQLKARLLQNLHIDMPLQRIFEAPTVAELAGQIEQLARSEQQILIPPLSRQVHQASVPLSFAQQRLYFLDQLHPGSSAYTVPQAVRLQGQVSVAALDRSIQAVVARHESLRTTFSGPADQAVQTVAPTLPIELPVIDLRAIAPDRREILAQQLVQAIAQSAFDLHHGPLIRVGLLRTAEQEQIFYLAMHHIISDGWSLGVFVREVISSYEAFLQGTSSPLSPLPIQYRDFALWQRQLLQGPLLETLLSYWRQQLQGATYLDLPTDRPRSSHASGSGTSYTFALPVPLSNDLYALSHQEGTTLFMTLLAAFQILLARYTGREDIVVGTDIANRTRVETEELIGFFVNLLPLRMAVNGKGSFRSLLGSVRQMVLDAYIHQDLPFDMLVDHLQLPRMGDQTPLIQVLFVLQNMPMSSTTVSGITVQPIETEETSSKFDLAVFLAEGQQGLHGTVTYREDLFEASTISTLIKRFEALLWNILAQPDASIDTLGMATVEEQARHSDEKITLRQRLQRSRGERIDLDIHTL